MRNRNRKFTGHCPRCGTAIPSERLLGNSSIVCSCGWTDSSAQFESTGKTERSIMMSYLIASFVIILGFGQLISWGNYAFVMPFLKLGQTTGMITAGGIETIITACLERSKWQCLDRGYNDLYEKTKNPEVLARYSRILMKQGNWELAASVLGDYANKAGGKSPEVLFDYGQALERTGHADLALAAYQKAVQVPNTATGSIGSGEKDQIQPRALAAVLRLLMGWQRNQEAFDQLTALAERSERIQNYFSKELSELHDRLHISAHGGASSNSGTSASASTQSNNNNKTNSKKNGMSLVRNG